MLNDVLMQVSGLERHYPGGHQIGPIALQLHRGETVGLLGPNGAGKSTTMAMLCGVLAPSCGQITVAGHDLIDDPIAAKRCIGYLPETPPLHLDLTVDEYLRYCARLRGTTNKKIGPQLERAKAECDLLSVGGRVIGNLSRGYKQRVGIAQAIIHDPQVLILDEPTNALDPLQIQQIHQLIQQLSTTRTILLSTHILSEAERLCQRAFILHKGQLHPDHPLAPSTEASSSEQLLVRFQNAPSVPDIEALACCDAVQPVDKKNLLIHTSSPDLAMIALAEIAHSRAWHLQEIGPAKRPLEKRFMEITQNPNHSTGAAR